jgi:hypothetical protein
VTLGYTITRNPFLFAEIQLKLSSVEEMSIFTNSEFQKTKTVSRSFAAWQVQDWDKVNASSYHLCFLFSVQIYQRVLVYMYITEHGNITSERITLKMS